MSENSSSIKMPSEASVKDRGAYRISDDHDFVVGITLFTVGEGEPKISAASLKPIAPTAVVAGQLCRAARMAVSLSQAQFSRIARVSQKTLNDYENGMILPKPQILGTIREALEAEGAEFVNAKGTVGVITRIPRAELEKRSRSPSVSPLVVTPTKPDSRPRGRPRNLD